MIFSPPTRRARPCAPVGSGYLCFKETSVSFSAFYHLQLSPAGEKGCLPVTSLVRFATRLDFFIFFASGNGWDGIISSFRFVIKINVKLKFTGIMEVVVIEKATFERMLSGFEIFAEKVERLCREQEDLGEKLSLIHI